VRTIVAFLVAPMLPALPPAWFLHFNYPDRTAISGFIVVCGIFYVLQMIVGIPAYFLARTYRRYMWFYLLLGSIGMIAVYSAVIIIFSKPKVSFAEELLQFPYFGAIGAGIGLVFWLVARPDRRPAKTSENSN
jgi:hypothetical protein